MHKKIIPNEELIKEIGRIIQEGSDVMFRPKGMSMHPFIIGGRDSVLLTKAGHCLKPGDIVLAKVGDGNFVLHRIESVVGNVLILMGDGNLEGRERCTTEDVIAVAIKIIKDKKEIHCRSSRHMRQARMWKMLLPIRRYLLAIYRKIIL